MLRTPLPELDPAAPTSLVAQVAAFYAGAIRDGRMAPGDRLPPIREAARACAIARATVQAAYQQLAADGLVEATVGRGTIVCELPATSRLHAAGQGSAPVPALSPYARAALRRTQDMPGAPPLPAGVELVANLAELAPDGEQFPVAEWRAAMDAVLRQRGGEVLGYGHEPNGLPELREAIAARLRDVDPTATADGILVTAGAQQALDLVLRTLCAPGDTVLVTDPSYHQMHGLLRAHGLQVAAIPFGPAGLDVAALRQRLQRGDVRLLYLMPTFHNPTGRTLDLAQRHELIETLRSTEVTVVEDEYQQSLRCRGEPLPTLRSLDPRRRTVTVATFSKELFPALRIGWVQAEAELLAAMAAVKRFMDLETSPLLQAALVEFLRRGSLDRHLDELRGELRRRHAALQAAAHRHLPPGCRLGDPDGGFVTWLELPGDGLGDRLAELAAARGVRVVPGCVFELHGRPSRGVRLCLARAPLPAIDAGLAVLGAAARELLAGPAPVRAFL
ncbi:MAG: PLP-dependent aminotransferase family protein [Planctomycetes bacterium]|nr:PLP-dependent aminotransferase family protein [Planctomycetota bacterium]